MRHSYEKGEFGHRDTNTGRTLCEDDLPTSQGRSKIASQTPEARHEAQNRFSLLAHRRNQSSQHPDFELLASREL